MVLHLAMDCTRIPEIYKYCTVLTKLVDVAQSLEARRAKFLSEIVLTVPRLRTQERTRDKHNLCERPPDSSVAYSWYASVGRTAREFEHHLMLLYETSITKISWVGV